MDRYLGRGASRDGFSSGEGLIYQVRDKRKGDNKNGDPIVKDQGAEDKRLFVWRGSSPEFSRWRPGTATRYPRSYGPAWDAGRALDPHEEPPSKATRERSRLP